MNAAIGVYDTHELAIAAVQHLKDAGYPVTQLSLMGETKTEIVHSDMHTSLDIPVKPTPIGFGALAGAALGLLTGVGIFAIPGFGFLFGAGAFLGAFAGADIGLIGGSIASALSSVGVTEKYEKKYHDALLAGKFLVIAHGDLEEVDRAQKLLAQHGTHIELSVH